MKIWNIRLTLKEIITKIVSVLGIAGIVTLIAAVYVLGLARGYFTGKTEAESEFIAFLSKEKEVPTPTMRLVSPTPTTKVVTVIQKPNTSWGGPELWDAVNKRRVELGVNSLQQRDELCTIASIRLNELLDLDALDSHEGFSKLRDERKDLDWIFEKYSTMAEFLAVGGRTPEETVSLWENTLGHKKLLTGGEYVWGCIYAQETFAVAITAF